GVRDRGGGQRRRGGPGARPSGAGRGRLLRLGGSRKRRREAAQRLRGRLRSDRRDRPERWHEGHRAGAQVCSGSALMSPTTPPRPASGLRVLVVDDERPALDELSFLLRRDPRIGAVMTSSSATEALKLLRETDVDAVFLDISMPGLTGLEMAQVLARFRTPPPIVFVTAHEQHAVDAFELAAVDYVLKPVREERLAEAVRRVVDHAPAPVTPQADEQIPVELGGV